VEVVIVSRLPLYLSGFHLADWHVTCHSDLGDVGSFSSQSTQDFVQVDGLAGSTWDHRVSNVLEANNHLVSGDWGSNKFHVSKNTCLLHGRGDSGKFRIHSGLSLEVEEVLSRHVCSQLNLSLHIGSLRLVEELHLVRGWYSNSYSIWILLVVSFWHSLVVTSWNSSMLHEFNHAWFKWGSSLRSIVHYGEDKISIIHRKSGLNWVEVTSHIWVVIIQVLLEVPSWSIVQDSLLHFKAIGVSVKSLLVVKIINSELSNNLVSIETRLDVWKTIEVNIKLDSAHISKINMDNNSSFILNCGTILGLEVEVPLLIARFGCFFELRVHISFVLTICWFEVVSTSLLMLMPHIWTDPWTVVFHTHVHCLLNISIFVSERNLFIWSLNESNADIILRNRVIFLKISRFLNQVSLSVQCKFKSSNIPSSKVHRDGHLARVDIFSLKIVLVANNVSINFGIIFEDIKVRVWNSNSCFLHIGGGWVVYHNIEVISILLGILTDWAIKVSWIWNLALS